MREPSLDDLGYLSTLAARGEILIHGYITDTLTAVY